MKMKRQVALLVISALLIGLLPMGNATVSKAANTSASTAGYGLNNPTTDSNGVTTWDCVWFGNYWQEDTNGDGKADKNDAKQPIKWRVMSVNGDDAFLLADKNLDVQRYNDTYTSVTWETCTMRSWLNGYGAASNKEGKDYAGSNFLDYAFSFAEQSAIRTTNVVNDDNSFYGTEGGNDTSDKVYLLSIDEAMNPAYGFTSTEDSTKTRQAVNTSYVAAGGEIKSSGMISAGSAAVWWLRSPGYDSYYASVVDYSGYVTRSGDYVNSSNRAARPALHLNLSSTSSWSYAGTVTSEGGEIGTATPVPSAQPTTSVSGSNSDSVTLFEDCGGSINSEGIADYLIADWKIKSPTFPVAVKKEPGDDGKYKIKATIGIGRKDVLDKDSTWNQYKSCVKKFKENSAKTSELLGFIETFGGNAGTFSVTEKMEAKPTLAFAGYYEIVCDKNNNIVSQEGGGTATATWSLMKKSWQSIVMAGPVPIPLYFDLTGKIDLEGKLGISFASLDDRTVTGSLKLKPSAALGGGLGVSGVASVGVEGNIGLDAQLIPASKGSYNASLALKAYIAFILDWTYQLPGAEMEGTIWDTTKRSRLFEPFSDSGSSTASEEPSLSLIDRSYGEKTTEWYGSGKPQPKSRSFRASDEYSSVSVSSLQEYVMPNTIPLVQSVGGKTVMVFQSNDSGRNTADSSCLMYSVREDGVWSQPKAVWDTGTCDLFADMKVIDGTLYLVWQKEKSEISGSTDAADILDEMEKNSEICMAVFDAETGEFGQMQYITDDEETDMMPVLAESSSEVSVVWIQNTAGSFFGESGENRVMSATRQGDSLTAPVQLGVTEDYVNELAAAYTGEKLKAAIVTTKITRSEDPESRAEASIPCVSVCTRDGQEVLSSASEYAGSVRFLDGKMYYLEDTFIYEYDLQTGEATRISAGEVLAQENVSGEDGEAVQTERTVFGSSYHIYRENGKTAIIWNEATDTGSVLKSSVKTEDGFSAPVTIFATEDGKTIQNFDAILTADGDWQFAVNTRTASEDKSAIEYVSKESVPKLKVDYMMAEESERENGIQPVHISVTNESEETVTEYTIRIYTDETSYVEKTVECQILPGESFTFDEEVDLAELDGQAELNVQVVADGQKEMDDTTASAPVGMTDLSLKLEKQVASDNKSVTFSALVKNESEVETAAHVALYEKETGELIVSREVGVLAPGGQKTLDFVLSADDVALNDADAKYYGAVAVSSKEEYNEENNTDYGVVYADEMKQDSPTASPSGTPEPTEEPGATPTEEPSAKPTASPGTEEPDVTPTAKPSEKPTTTPVPTKKPDATPTAKPSEKPTTIPGTEKPDATPTVKPSVKPTTTPVPTKKPDATPTAKPSAKPTTSQETEKPDVKPTAAPGTEHSPIPTTPSVTSAPTKKPDATSTAKPSAKPTTKPGAVTPFVPVYPSQTFTPVLQPTASPTATSVGRVASIKLTQKKRTVTALWKKVPGADGYQIWYSTSKKWKGKKQKLLRKNKVTVKNLKKKKTYYFRIRVYQLDGAEKIYGAWSKTKKIKMKK